MCDDAKLADHTLAHVALSLKCRGCYDGPDEVHLTATIHGIWPPTGNVSLVWTMPLVERHGRGAKRMRFASDGATMIVDTLPLHLVEPRASQ